MWGYFLGTVWAPEHQLSIIKAPQPTRATSVPLDQSTIFYTPSHEAQILSNWFVEFTALQRPPQRPDLNPTESTGDSRYGCK